MRAATVGLIVALGLLCTGAAEARYVTGSELLRDCEGREARLYCGGYISGATELASDMKFVCLPSTVGLDQQVRIVEKYLRDNPARLHQPAFALVVTALATEFPCTKEQPR